MLIGDLRSFFPLCPAPPGSFLDSSKAAALDLPMTPNLLILPSQLAPFVKLLPMPNDGASGQHTNAEKVVCVNPGFLAKGPTGK